MVHAMHLVKMHSKENFLKCSFPSSYTLLSLLQVIARALLANSAVLYSLQDSYKALQEGRSPQLTAHHFQQSAAFDNWVAAELAAAKQSLKLQSRLQNFCAVVEVQVLSADHLQRRKDAAAT